jgi:hypothetical protein
LTHRSASLVQHRFLGCGVFSSLGITRCFRPRVVHLDHLRDGIRLISRGSQEPTPQPASSFFGVFLMNGFSAGWFGGRAAAFLTSADSSICGFQMSPICAVHAHWNAVMASGHREMNHHHSNVEHEHPLHGSKRSGSTNPHLNLYIIHI